MNGCFMLCKWQRWYADAYGHERRRRLDRWRCRSTIAGTYGCINDTLWQGNARQDVVPCLSGFTNWRVSRSEKARKGGRKASCGKPSCGIRGGGDDTNSTCCACDGAPAVSDGNRKIGSISKTPLTWRQLNVCGQPGWRRGLIAGGC